ncbi:gamma carbonic anhydrase family protein [Brumimicrobium aurantiacum]|uniref:Gamma carbonic anhydrase family protein n=1 Tax=Brumimicrobium aurantiacum TaxID=1737063 RepID=A0A3E1EYA4_9FLAO|nr:gamma carbonic anhydrase family protein [Brumimicrobium aurantiacum]RFC54532.1 gamma carbonic anhydrase family protein [Brumimicrobium aurantiacum]
MALIKECRGYSPQIAEDCWIAENATIVGDVKLGKGTSVWFSAVVRGDVNTIQFGENCNIQDGAVIHCTYEKSKTIAGNNVSIGHNAIVHGCKIGNNVLIGMGAIVMDNAVVNDNVLIAAGAVVLENTVLESNSVYAGTPAKRIKSLSEKTFEGEVKRIANNYGMYASWFSEKNQ